MEMLIAALLMMFALTAVSIGFLFMYRGERLVSVQNKLDIDVRRSLERVRIDLRLSSLDKVFYYPMGPGPYTAISLPLAHDDNGDGLPLSCVRLK
jgi:hypothetical protein